MSTQDWLTFSVELAKILFSFPVAIVVVAAILIVNFKPEIASWIQSMRFRYGQFEALSQPPASVPSTQAVDTSSLPKEAAPPAAEEPPPQTARTIDTKNATAESELDDLRGQLAFQTGEMWRWFFSFLDLYLVANTKRVIAWLNRQSKPVPLAEFHRAWSFEIPNILERGNILQALGGFNLVTIYDANIHVSPSGEEFVRWANLGALADPMRFTFPPPPTPPKR